MASSWSPGFKYWYPLIHPPSVLTVPMFNTYELLYATLDQSFSVFFIMCRFNFKSILEISWPFPRWLLLTFLVSSLVTPSFALNASSLLTYLYFWIHYALLHFCALAKLFSAKTAFSLCAFCLLGNFLLMFQVSIQIPSPVCSSHISVISTIAIIIVTQHSTLWAYTVCLPVC